MKLSLCLFSAIVLVVACSNNRDIYPLPPNPNSRANATPTPASTPTPSTQSQTITGLSVDTSDVQVLNILADGKLITALPGAKIIFANPNFVAFKLIGPGGEQLSYLMNRVARKTIEECECEISGNKSFAVVKYLKPELNSDQIEFFKTIGYNEVGQSIFNRAAKEKDGITTVMSENFVGYIAAKESALFNVEKGLVMRTSQAVQIDLAGGKATVRTDGDQGKTYDEKGNESSGK